MTLEEYISVHSTPENEVLESIVRDTHIHILNPHMLSGHVQGRVLSMISHMIRPNRILELGTFNLHRLFGTLFGGRTDRRRRTRHH